MHVVIRGVGIALIAGAVSALLWPGGVESQQPRLQKPNPEAGERVYRQNCVNCHGASGRGDGAAAGKLDPRPADLTSATTQAKRDTELLETIKFGRPGTAMPGWMSELDERDLRDVLAYLRTLAAPSPY
ncbi:MAG: cytochrome c [Nitrospirae bacterium]|nr:MAG: cytochrome c [Nitrospirota bacterium]